MSEVAFFDTEGFQLSFKISPDLKVSSNSGGKMIIYYENFRNFIEQLQEAYPMVIDSIPVVLGFVFMIVFTAIALKNE